MKCPECGGPGLVLQSRFDGATKRRDRRCCNCDARYTSREILVTRYTPDPIKAYLRFLSKGDRLTIKEKVRLQRQFNPRPTP